MYIIRKNWLDFICSWEKGQIDFNMLRDKLKWNKDEHLFLKEEKKEKKKPPKIKYFYVSVTKIHSNHRC